MEADSLPMPEDSLLSLDKSSEVDLYDAETIQSDFNAEQHKSAWQNTREFLSRHKGKLALGAAALSTTLTLTMNPLEEVQKEVIQAAPIIGTGIAVSEGMFIGGAAIMASSVGSRVRNPLKLKERMPDICQKANDSLLFKTGFWTNTVGAVGTAAFISAGVIAKLPPESYGVLSFAALDLGATVAIRKVMLSGIKNNLKSPEELTK